MDAKSEVAHEETSYIDSMKVIDDTNDYVPGTEEERKLVRKIDLFLLPTLWLMYLLSYMDRTK